MIDPGWIVPPVGVANESVADIFYFVDLVNGVLVSDVLIADEPLQFIFDIIAAPEDTLVTSGPAEVIATQITKTRAEILLAFIRANVEN